MDILITRTVGPKSQQFADISWQALKAAIKSNYLILKTAGREFNLIYRK